MNQIFHDIPDYTRVNRAVQTQCCVLFSVDPSISRHIQSDLLAHHSITPLSYTRGPGLIVQNIFLDVGFREINKSVSGDNRLP